MKNLLNACIGIALAFGIAGLLTRYLCRPDSLLRILDHPVARSLHHQPIPRTGGIAILTGGLVGVVWVIFSSVAPDFGWGSRLMGLVPLLLISLLDDRFTVAVSWRLAAHLGAALSLLGAGDVLRYFELPSLTLALPVWLGIPVSALFIVWMINLYNFMDGMDGFAGGMAVIGFSTLAWLGRDNTGYIVLCLIVVAVSIGFLMYNFPPAKIFLGDTGSTGLGFLAAACSIWGSTLELFPFWLALLVFSPFIVDSTITLMRRMLKGEKIWEGHRTHYYQRLVLLGWGTVGRCW